MVEIGLQSPYSSSWRDASLIKQRFDAGLTTMPRKKSDVQKPKEMYRTER
jgi:hypothetical protein